MVRGTDSASMTPARRAALAIGLLGCLADAGCARLGSFRQGNHPDLGAVSKLQERPDAGLPGDLYAEVRVMVPKTLGKRERELFEELAAMSDFDPRRA